MKALSHRRGFLNGVVDGGWNMLVEKQEELEQKIGYHFKDRKLLLQALTHSSYANEQKINKTGDYERLEFLGDAVLELVSSDYMFRENPQMPEGQLTKRRSSMVCEPALAFCARELVLEKYILLGKGEEATGGRKRDSIISDVMEAIIGAIYLDGGLEPATAYVERFLLSDIENKRLFYDAKTHLQEQVQADTMGEIEYRLVDEQGPDHCKNYAVEVWIHGACYGTGEGSSRKNAEQKAAYAALLAIRHKEG